MTKAQRKARAKRAGSVRRKANAVKAFMRKMNPGKKAPVAVRVKRLKGGGISVTPLKINLSKRKAKKEWLATRLLGPGSPTMGEALRQSKKTTQRTTHSGRRSRSRGTWGFRSRSSKGNIAW